MNIKNSIDETTNAKHSLIYSSLKSKYENCLKPYETKKLFNTKVIDCGDYIQVYFFDMKHSVNTEDSILNKKEKQKIIDYNLSNLSISDIDTDELIKVQSNKSKIGSILDINAKRSNMACQRLARCNCHEWNTFITLTFEDTDEFDIESISDCNIKFNNFISNIRKLKPDFKYLAVPEFQNKRGIKYGKYAVHYHLLSNLSKEDSNIIYPQKEFTEKQLLKMSESARSKCYDVKYWSKGFARVDFVKDDCKKIFSYICKYMTKDIDNKLFGKKRYFFSRNLKKPTTCYLDLENNVDFEYFLYLQNNYNVDFQSSYEDIYTKTQIKFIEYRKPSVDKK